MTIEENSRDGLSRDGLSKLSSIRHSQVLIYKNHNDNNKVIYAGEDNINKENKEHNIEKVNESIEINANTINKDNVSDKINPNANINNDINDIQTESHDIQTKCDSEEKKKEGLINNKLSGNNIKNN